MSSMTTVWDNDQSMTLYDNAICAIVSQLDTVIATTSASSSRIVPTNRSENRNYDRTPYGLYVQTSSVVTHGSDTANSSTEETITKLLTPRGRVHLRDGGCADTLDKISQAFMANMDWALAEVTNTLQSCAYFADEQRVTPRRFPVPLETWKGAQDTVKVYNITRVGGLTLPIVSEYIYFHTVCY